MKLKRVISILAFCVGAAGLPAQVMIDSYIETGNLPPNDDNFSSAVDLGFTINFGGTTYTQTFVSNNGYLTFGAGSYEYYPPPLDANYSGYPIIAAFFADVDTREQNSGIVSWGTGTLDGHAAFAANWNAVGEYSYGTTPNTFQIVLIDRSDIAVGNFDVQLNYGTITWDHGGSVVAGFHNGNPTTPLFYQLPGSLVQGAFVDGGPNSLMASTNAGSAGNIMLQARDGSFLEVTEIVAIPEPSTYALLALGLGVVLMAARRRNAA